MLYYHAHKMVILLISCHVLFYRKPKMGMDSFRPTTDRFDLVRNALRRIEQCVWGMYALQRGPSKLVASTRRGNFLFAFSRRYKNVRTCQMCHFEGEFLKAVFTCIVLFIGPTKSLNNLEKKDHEKDSSEENTMRCVCSYFRIIWHFYQNMSRYYVLDFNDILRQLNDLVNNAPRVFTGMM